MGLIWKNICKQNFIVELNFYFCVNTIAELNKGMTYGNILGKYKCIIQKFSPWHKTHKTKWKTGIPTIKARSIEKSKLKF